MSQQEPRNPQTTTDEIDLGQLLTLIKQGLFGIFKGVLQTYQFFRKRALTFIILAIVGAALGFGLNTIRSTKLKTDVIVMPTLESKRYLNNIVDEINANIKAEDELFFDSLQIEIAAIKNYEVTIESLDMKGGKEMAAEMNYLELLQDFENSDATADIIRNVLLDQNSREHRITFLYTDPVKGPEIATKLMDYINNNKYFLELAQTYTSNANSRIVANDSIIRQLDLLIDNYTQNISDQNTTAEGQLVLQEEDQLAIHELFALKNELIAQSEAKRIELINREQPIRVVNFGKPHPVQLPLFGKSIFYVPLILIALFILYEAIRYLDRKSTEILS